jgi:hypothetical protein
MSVSMVIYKVGERRKKREVPAEEGGGGSSQRVADGVGEIQCIPW